jgi:hypothetical protein
LAAGPATSTERDDEEHTAKYDQGEPDFFEEWKL